eukprot:379313_1
MHYTLTFIWFNIKLIRFVLFTEITRIPIQFPFLCLDPHSIVLNPSGRIHFYPHEASTATASEPFHVPHLMTLSPIAPHPSDHPMSHGRPIPNPSNVASPQCIYIGFSG